MKIYKTNGRYCICLSAKELTIMLVTKFFKDLTSEISSEKLNEADISNHIKKLSDRSVDSHDYEYFASILDIYEHFEENCDFCFYLKPSYDYKKEQIKTLDDLTRYKEDPPDVVILYKENFYEFELKRYREEVAVDPIYDFIKKKIINHYSGKRNYFIIFQPKPFSGISFKEFKELHEKIKKEKNVPGIISFSLNNDNKEMMLIQIFPDLKISKRKYKTEAIRFSDLLHSE